ncbi:MAG: rRNA maturation RNase YbeY [Chthoniobacteraceae bacterium]|jgi:probable rRNA maturation factor
MAHKARNAMAAPRAIHIYNRQRAVRFDLAWLRRFAPIALAACEGEGIPPGVPLGSLAEIEVSIVSDRAIAAVHRRFMNIPGATDVLTFEHGEIIVSAATAARYAREYAQPLEHEIGLYIIHGLLHLNGHDDLAGAAASLMQEMQSRLLDKVLKALCATQ